VEPNEPRRRHPRRGAPGIAQLPWRRLVNPYRPIEILTADQVEAIHRSSLRILAEIGMEVLGDRVLDAFAGQAPLTADPPDPLDPAHVGSRCPRAIVVPAACP
jgi:trimethylamine--corrinoid protein Co-methyltransferase